MADSRRADPLIALLPLAGEHFPATLLYNEGWLLRLCLDCSARQRLSEGPLAIPPGGTWYSEALLPSAFAPRRRGDPLAESRTHADAAVGHFEVGVGSKGGLTLADGATHLTVLEAKLSSPLSVGVLNVRGYGQAARTVACMAEVLRRAGQRPDGLSLAYRVLAPRRQVGAGYVEAYRESVRCQVEKRVGAYDGERDEWYREWFLPVLDRTALAVVAWEDAIAALASASGAEVLGAFYERCLVANAPYSGQPHP